LSLMKHPEVRKLLDEVLTWSFDIIGLESICQLQYVLVTALSQCFTYTSSGTFFIWTRCRL